MIERSLADAALCEALTTGGDFAEIFIEDTSGLSLSVLDGTVENANSTRSYGVGIRILSGVQSVYAYANDTSPNSLLQTAKNAAAALSSLNHTLKPEITFAAQTQKNFLPIVQYPGTITNQDKINVMLQSYRVCKAESTQISQVSVGYSDVDQRILVCNSDGLWATDRRIRTRIMVQAIASNSSEFQTGYEAPGRSMGFEIFKKEVDVEQIAKQAAQQAVTMLMASECPATNAPVVIDGGFGGVIFHEACGHALEATAVGKGNSVFCGKLGQKIAADCVSAVDDGTIQNEWGTLNIDDEGQPTQCNQLIQNGVLKGYLIDRLGSRRMGMPVTGSARRQSYKYSPTSRMNNTYIAAGQDDDQEIIDSMAEGLYAKSMGGGSVNPLTGEFNFSVREGYWVKNGDIRPVRGATLIGKGADILMKIDRVGKDMTMAAGMCGSVSGYVPVNVGQPRIRVSSMTIGGKGGTL